MCLPSPMSPDLHEQKGGEGGQPTHLKTCVLVTGQLWLSAARRVTFYSAPLALRELMTLISNHG